MRCTSAMIWLAVLSAPASAETSIEKCRGVPTDKERLACFDAIAAATPPQPSPSKWDVDRSQSKLDRSEIIVAILKATEASKSSATYSVSAYLMLRCSEKQTAAFITFQDNFQGSPEIIGYEYADVEYRIGDAPVKTARWGISETKSAYGPFSTKPSIEFAKSLLAGKDLFVRARSKIGGTTTSHFELAGIEAALKDLRSSCGW